MAKENNASNNTEETIDSVIFNELFTINRNSEGKVESISPKLLINQDWAFKGKDFNEAFLAYALGTMATDNDMDANELRAIFPVILRIMKSKSGWANL